MEKTHWKKNNDSNFISGEDLQSGLKGLKPEMIVVIEKFSDAQSFDQTKSAKITVTGLFLKEVGGQSLYKPVILNKTNAKFFVKETGSDFVDDWIGKPVIIHAQKDARHGYVVRFKKYVFPVLLADSEDFKKCKLAIEKSGFSIDQIRQKYQVSSEVELLLTTKSNTDGK
jgi:hypothetical protein